MCYRTAISNILTVIFDCIRTTLLIKCKLLSSRCTNRILLDWRETMYDRCMFIIDTLFNSYRYSPSWKPADVQTSFHLFIASRFNELSSFLTSRKIFAQ